MTGPAVAALALAACWPGPHANPDRTGHNAFESALTTATVGDLEQQWDIPGGSVPIVVGSGIYQTVTTAASFDLRRLDAATGAVVWSTPLPGVSPSLAGSTAGPWYVDDQVYVGWQNLLPFNSPSGGGIHVDPRTGSVTTTVPMVHGRRHAVRADRVLSTSRASLSGTRYESYVVSDRHTGAIVRIDTVQGGLDDDDSFAYTLTPQAIVVSASGVDQPDGSLGGEIRSIPIVASAPTWTTPLPASTPTAAVVDTVTGTLHVGTAEGHLVTLDTTTGAVLWTVDVGGTVTQLPALADRNLYVTTGAGELVVVDADGCGADTCTPSWRAPLGGSGATQPAAGGVGESAVVYVAVAGGVLAALPAAGCGAAACAPLWTGAVTGSITGGPIVSGGQVYVTTDAGRLVAFGLP